MGVGGVFVPNWDMRTVIGIENNGEFAYTELTN